jgi:hypothetical protein
MSTLSTANIRIHRKSLIFQQFTCFQDVDSSGRHTAAMEQIRAAAHSKTFHNTSAVHLGPESSSGTCCCKHSCVNLWTSRLANTRRFLLFFRERMGFLLEQFVWSQTILEMSPAFNQPQLPKLELLDFDFFAHQ